VCCTARKRGRRRGNSASEWLCTERAARGSGSLGLDGGRARERGISVSSALMSFEHRGSPSTSSTRHATRISAHGDFSEDTYRTLTAVPHPSLRRLRPPAGRVREGAIGRCPQWRQGGIEEQTRKLFEVCRLRNVPIITFLNKLDRERRDPSDLLDEIE
jgi:peptide chain release factor 3